MSGKPFAFWVSSENGYRGRTAQGKTEGPFPSYAEAFAWAKDNSEQKKPVLEIPEEDVSAGVNKELKATPVPPEPIPPPEPPPEVDLSKVYVSANRISDISLEIDVKPNITAAELKERIEQQWKVPTSCQKLVIGSTEILDLDQLSRHRKPGAAGLSVKLVVSLENVLQDLVSHDSHRRQAALGALAMLGPAGGEEALAAVGASLNDLKADVRYAAVRALALVADRGDPAAISAVCARLEDQDIGVRHAAGETLLQVADKDNDIAITCLCQCLEHRDCAVRNEVVELLAEVADKGNERAMWEIGMRLENQSSGVQRAALRALGQVSPEGHEGAIAAIRMFVVDKDAGVRRAAAAALVQVGSPLYPTLDPDSQEAYDLLLDMRDEYFLKLALTAADDVALEVSNIDGKSLAAGNAEVVTCDRGHALMNIGTVFDDGWVCDGSCHPAGCRSGITDFYQTTGMCRYRCGACDYDLCQKCVDAKAEENASTKSRGKQLLLEAATKWRSHPVVLGKNGEAAWRPELSNGDEDPLAVEAEYQELALTFGSRNADDSDDDVPALLDVISDTAANHEPKAEAEEEDDDDMPALLEVDDDDAADTGGDAAVEGDWRERELALQTLAMEADRGDSAAITSVSRCLADSNERVRRTALEVLAEVVETGDEIAMQAVSENLQHTNAFIRRDAVTALALVSEQGDEKSISMVEACLKDSHSCVRKAAIEAIAVLADKSEMGAMGVPTADDEPKRLVVKASVGERVITPMSTRLEIELNSRNRQAAQDAMADVPERPVQRMNNWESGRIYSGRQNPRLVRNITKSTTS